MNRNNYLRVAITIVMGISIPVFSGVLRPARYNTSQFLISCVFFITLSFFVFVVSRTVHFYLRSQPWINIHPVKKILIITMVNALLSVLIAGILVYIWSSIMRNYTSPEDAVQFLLNMIMVVIMLVLSEELILMNRERKLQNTGLQAFAAATPIDIRIQHEPLTQVTYMNRRKSRLLLRKGYENIPVKVDDTAMFYTENKIVYAIDSSGRKFISDKKLSELEAELSSDMFFRANRQYIIGLNFIKGFKPFDKVKLQVDISVSDARIVISQETAPAFRKWMNEA